MECKDQFKIGLFFLAIIPLLFASSFANAGKTQITVTDLANRTVTLDVPVTRIVLGGWTGSGNPFYTLFGLLGEQTPDSIVGMDAGLKKNRKWIWQKFVERYPKLATIPDVGSPPEINIEKIISLNPDVVFVPTSAAKSSMDVFDKLQQAGIPVVMNDYHTETYETHLKSIELIGQIVGKPDRAEEMADFYRKQCSIVEDRICKASGPKPKVYIELGINAEEYGNTYGNKMWGVLIPRSGGNNIAADLVDGYAPLSPEKVLQENPEVIILTGANWPKRQNSLQLGYYADAKDAQALLKKFLGRPGWADLAAAKNKRIYGIHHGLSREVWDFYPIQCFAKWFYPELFSDLDPDETLKEFHRRFFDIDLSGTWSIALN